MSSYLETMLSLVLRIFTALLQCAWSEIRHLEIDRVKI